MIYALCFLAGVFAGILASICIIIFLPTNNKYSEDNLQNSYSQGYKDGRKMLSIINKKNKDTHKF